MLDYILIAILLLIAGAIVLYLIGQKKKGVVCVGCPHAKECASKKKGAANQCACGCCSHNSNSSADSE